MNFGERLKLAREKQGMWQKDAAFKLNITGSQLSRYENNITSPDPGQIANMAKLYKVSTDFLFGLDCKLNTAPSNVSIIREKPLSSEYVSNANNLLSGFENLPDDKKRVIIRLIRLFLENS